MPPLAACYNLMDFEAVARQVMKKTAWAYYSSGADDEIVRTIPPFPYLRIPICVAWLYTDQFRRCERTTPLSTRSGSAHES
jgi:hypothetical protein